MSECKNFSPSPEFKWLCDELLQKIYDTSSTKHLIGKPVAVRYLEIINNFIKLWRSTVGNYIFPALRLIIPFRDKRVYNVKENTLIKALCRYLRLPKDSETENRLLRWKQRAARGVKLSDFCVEEIRKRQKEYEGSTRISIDELNGFLDEIAREGNGKRMGYMALTESKAFNYCLQHMTFVELKFFFDIILKTRVLSGLENKFLLAWHPDAQDYLSVVSDLDVLSKRLYNPMERLRQQDLSITLSHAFEPQLAKRTHASYEHVASKLNYSFLIEEKMDGERLQIHYMNYGEQIKYLSRRGIDFSYLYGEDKSHGPVSPHIKLHPNVKDCILDGEMVTYDTEKDVVLPFGLVKSSALNQIQSELAGTAPAESYRPLFVVFDMVYLNGKSLTSLQLHRRKNYLEKVLEPAPQRVQIIEYTKSSTADSIKESLEQAISVGSEGIVLKELDSRYSIASRNFAWIKIKPEYLEQFGENMDLLIIGRDQGKKDSFLCGLSISSYNDPAASPKFISFCTVANGFSAEEFKDIERQTRGKWHIFSEDPPDSNVLEFGSKLPYEWIHPKDSVVLEIKARAVDNKESEKKKYRSGCTLYYSYCKQIRYDKDWKTVASLSEFEDMKEARTFYNKRRPHEVTSEKSRSSKRARVGILHSKEQNVLENPTSDIFTDCKFKIISDYFDTQRKRRITQEELYSIVLENGGEVLYTSLENYPSDKNLYIIGNKLTRECKVLVESNHCIIKPSWVLRSVESGYKQLIKPTDIFKGKWDRDSDFSQFYEDFDEERFNKLIETSHSDSHSQSISDSSDTIPHTPLFLFDGWNIAIVGDYNVPCVMLLDLEFTVKCHGGNIVTVEDADIIVTFKDIISGSRLMSLRKEVLTKAIYMSNKAPPRIPRIVNVAWVADSVSKNFISLPDAYQCA